MNNRKKQVLGRGGIALTAVLAFVWFPIGFTSLISSAEQLLFGFDDMPLGTMVISFIVGVAVALYGLIVTISGVWRGKLHRPIVLTVSAVIFGVVALPASRLMARIEHEKRYEAAGLIYSTRISEPNR